MTFPFEKGARKGEGRGLDVGWEEGTEDYCTFYKPFLDFFYKT
jgi:hypothetical protein